ncbi:hypothetical protein EDD22DRAFT_851769 [Suillus occidentalis]|nr:hypothetical protein EDD22DRAFT_851769 [Suillus occidentalis]
MPQAAVQVLLDSSLGSRRRARYHEGKESKTLLKEERPGDSSPELVEALSISPLICKDVKLALLRATLLTDSWPQCVHTRGVSVAHFDELGVTDLKRSNGCPSQWISESVDTSDTQHAAASWLSSGARKIKGPANATAFLHPDGDHRRSCVASLKPPFDQQVSCLAVYVLNLVCVSGK